jgi:biopolymer transport protein ExbB
MGDALHETLAAGGWVLGIIFILSAVAWVIAIRKYVELSGTRQQVLHRRNGSEGQAGPGDLPIDRFFALARGKDRRVEFKVVAPVIAAARVQLQSGLSLVSGIAVALPLLGLLGTVLGMVTTFDVITVHGTGEPRLMADGIRQALVTTEAGLMGALPIILAHEYLAARAVQIENELWILAHREHLHQE